MESSSTSSRWRPARDAGHARSPEGRGEHRGRSDAAHRRRRANEMQAMLAAGRQFDNARYAKLLAKLPQLD